MACYKDIIDDSVVSDESKFLKKHNNIFITDEQLNILKRYNINVENYKSVQELIFAIEEYMNSTFDYPEDLDFVSASLAQYNYYNNTNK